MKQFLKRKTIKLFVVFALLALTAGMRAGAEESMPSKTTLNGIDPAVAQNIEAYVKEKMATLRSPGLAVGIVKGNTLIYTGYFGYADIENKKPVTEDTFFRIGSITKTVTTIGLMQQWELGKFNLDDDVNKYFPKPMIIPPHPETKPVTFRHLLTHMSGSGEFLSLRQFLTPGFGYMVIGDNYLPLNYYLRFKMKNKIDPGVKWAYCNYGFAFLGYALENIAKEPFHIYQQKHVFEPLGMKITSYHHNAEIIKRLAVGYKTNNGVYEIDPHKPIGITPVGAIYTNIEEWSHYVIALLNGGRYKDASILKPETLDMVMKTQHTLDPRQRGWGFGFEVYGDDIWGYRVVGHGGSVPLGFNAEMLLIPTEKIGVFVFSNSGNDMAYSMTWGVLKRVLGAEDKPLASFEPDRKVWPELAGYYAPEYPQFKTDTRLYMKGVGDYRVEISNNRLRLVYTWQGEKKGQVLRQVKADDPYFYLIEDPANEIPAYVSFKKKDNGKMYIVPGGTNEYVKIRGARKAKIVITAPAGRALTKVNPLVNM